MNAATTVLKYGPQAFELARKALTVIGNTEAITPIADVVSAGVQVAQATTGDGGLAGAAFAARQGIKGELMSHLDALIASFGNVLDTGEKQELHALHSTLKHASAELTQEHSQSLKRIFEQILSTNTPSETVSATETNSTATASEQSATATDQATTPEGSTDNAGPNDDTVVVLRNLLGLINTKLTKKNGHVFMFLKWVGPLLKPLGIKVPTPDELPGIVEKYITKNEQFTNALTACIENREVDTSKMSWWQKWTFSGCKKLLKHLANNSERVLEGAPQAAYALKYGAGAIIPILGRIPIIGGLLSLAFPFVVDELNSAGEVAEKGYLTAILERLVKYHGKNSEATAAV